MKARILLRHIVAFAFFGLIFGCDVQVAKLSPDSNISHLTNNQMRQFNQQKSHASPMGAARHRNSDPEIRSTNLERQGGLNTTKVKRQRLFTALSFLAAIISSITGFILFRRNQTQKATNKKLREREIIFSKQAIEAKKLLKQKTLLIEEINHRIKNNLQTIMSLLSTQRRCIGFSEADILGDVRSRVETMAVVQESFNAVEKVDSLKAEPFVSNLATRLIASSNKEIDLVLDIDNVELSADIAAPLALIINELVCNALKHAFKHRPNGQIKFDFKPTVDGKFRFSCQDNGIGLPNDFDLKTLNSFGLTIVQSLTEQIHGELTYETSNLGTRWTIEFQVVNTKVVEQYAAMEPKSLDQRHIVNRKRRFYGVLAQMKSVG